MTPEQKNLFLATLQEHGSCDVEVHGRSMWPFIRPGDTVTVRAPFTRPLPGSVVAFFDGDRLVVHRLIWHHRRARDRWDLWVQGDSSPESAGPVDSRTVIGTVSCLRRAGRTCRVGISGLTRWPCIPLGWILQTGVVLKSRFFR